MRERIEFVEKVQKLLRETDVNDVCLKYGYIDYEHLDMFGNPVFVQSDVDVNKDPDKREVVLIKYDVQSDMFGRIQSIECDGYFSILSDIIKTVKKL